LVGEHSTIFGGGKLANIFAFALSGFIAKIKIYCQ
jgi:hypothetical protein